MAPIEPLNERASALAFVLLEAVERREFNVSYKEVADRLSRRMGRTVNVHFGLGEPLGQVSTLCFELGLPLISAMVRYSGGTSAKTVGEGFYPFACELKPAYRAMDPVDVWRLELKQIRECQTWDRLRTYLETGAAAPPEATDESPGDDPFANWHRTDTPLAEPAAQGSAAALAAISREMCQRGLLPKPLEAMSAFELDIFLPSVLSDPGFIQKNARANGLYASALKRYRYFANTAFEAQEAPPLVDAIKHDATLPETERTALVQSRVGQGLFRKALMEKYRGRCVITGLHHPKLLVASHIRPWAVSTNRERLSVENGLLLSATCDRLFDGGLITFDEKGTLYVSPFLGPENEEKLGLAEGTRFDLGMSGEMARHLEYHREMLFLK